MQVQFYHLTSTPLERALPKLVEKAYSAGYKIHCVIENEERVEYINQLLWTYDPASFLPHGSAKEANAEKQPVFLSDSLDKMPNHPTLLMLTNGTTAPEGNSVERVLDIFDGNSETETSAARERWKHYRDAGREVVYYRQKENGGWEKKQ